jgi:hypothetical protein
MKNSLKLFLFTIVLFLILDRTLFEIICYVDKSILSGQSVGKVNHFFKIKDNAEILVFGNSRANHHIDNSLFNKPSFNCGMDGSNILYDYALISTLSNKNQLVILNLEPYGLNLDNFSVNKILPLSNLFYRENQIRSVFEEYLPFKSTIYRFTKIHSYNEKILGILKNAISPKYDYKNYLGFDPIIPNNTQKTIFKELLLQENIIKKRYDNSELILSSLGENILEKVIELCKDKNKNLIIIASPTYYGINKKLHDDLKEYFKDQSVDYYNYSNFFTDQNNIEYWKDFGHLSNIGANIFTKKLAKDLNIY